jgi:hypothetical protein
MSALLTETEVSHILRASLATPRKWRVDKRGPRFIKIGPLVRYQLEDLREWLSSLPTGGIRSMQPISGPAYSSPATGTLAFANSMKFALSTVPEVVI